VTVVGFRLMPDSVAVPALAGLTVKEAEVELADVAVIWADVELVTGNVKAANVPLFRPCGIVMLAGTDAAELLLDKLTNTPPLPAGVDNVTVPMAV